MIGDDHLVRRATQRFVLVVGAGAIGAAVCSTGLNWVDARDDDESRLGRSFPSPVAREIGPAEAEALTVLRRAAAADNATVYEGRKIFGGWSAKGGESVLAEVGHEPGKGTWLRVMSAGGHTDEGRSPRAEIADAGGELDPQALALLTDQYTLRVADPIRCIGRDATVVEATPIGGDRVAGRFWVDDESGLLLRHELYDSAGNAVRSTSFLDIDVATDPSPRRTLSTTFHATPDDGLLDAGELEDLRADGWVLPGVLPAGMVLYRARAVDVDGGEAVHLTYSDGLFSLSLFAQRGRLDTSELRGFSTEKLGTVEVYARSGLYRQVVWAAGDTVYTVVSDTPDTKFMQVVGALPHDEPGAGMRSRMVRGIERMGSWINPFA